MEKEERFDRKGQRIWSCECQSAGSVNIIGKRIADLLGLKGTRKIKGNNGNKIAICKQKKSNLFRKKIKQEIKNQKFTTF